MTRFLTIILSAIGVVIGTAAIASFAPVVPQLYPPVGSFGGPAVPSAPYPMIPNAIGGASPPSSCTGAIDFSSGCTLGKIP